MRAFLQLCPVPKVIVQDGMLFSCGYSFSHSSQHRCVRSRCCKNAETRIGTRSDSARKPRSQKPTACPITVTICNCLTNGPPGFLEDLHLPPNSIDTFVSVFCHTAPVRSSHPTQPVFHQLSAAGGASSRSSNGPGCSSTRRHVHSGGLHTATNCVWDRWA